MSPQLNKLILCSSVLMLTGCDFMERIEHKAMRINTYEKKALILANQNRQLKSDIEKLEYELAELKSRNNYLVIKLKKRKNLAGAHSESKMKSRNSIQKQARPHLGSLENLKQIQIQKQGTKKKELVNFHIFNWDDKKLLAMGDEYFKKKDYVKSSESFYTLISKYPDSKLINDGVLYRAALASYKSGKHTDWSIQFSTRLLKDYPNSPYYRSTKLWLALSFLKKGENNQFFSIVEEFRLKYRNTPEWDVLSKHYEMVAKNFR